MAKFIFVTGGVVSGLGKGITTASIGLLLKTAGISVDAVKFDPYLNIDPGTMSPYEHGEVYVLEDGSETDLDLGHYERFLDENLNHNSSVSSGKVYDSILNKERNGDYLGKNVQLIPNVTNFIQEKFSAGLEKKPKNHIRLIEIGGSTGDMEGEIFLESFRQFKQKKRGEILHIHLGYVPFLNCSGEYKTKPLQNSVRDLLMTGLQPDVIVARYFSEHGKKLNKEILEKIALFGNVQKDKVLSLPDLDSIYKVPTYLENSTIKPVLDEFTNLDLKFKLPDFFENVGNNWKKDVKIGIIAKYQKLTDAYLSLLESLKIAAVYNKVNFIPVFIDAEKLEKENFDQKEFDKLVEVKGIVVPGGFGSRGMEGKIEAIKYARENKIPFLGICLGLQMAVVEFARNIIGLKAYSSEMLDENKIVDDLDIIIDLIPSQKNMHKKGGTMRLGNYSCQLEDNTLAARIFGQKNISERHRHRLEVQEKYVEILEKNGLKISGKHFYKDEGEKKYLVELVELDTEVHPYFIATQSHPEFLSRPATPHPLFFNLIKNTLK
jgi:CTP synthase